MIIKTFKIFEDLFEFEHDQQYLDSKKEFLKNYLPSINEVSELIFDYIIDYEENCHLDLSILRNGSFISIASILTEEKYNKELNQARKAGEHELKHFNDLHIGRTKILHRRYPMSEKLYYELKIIPQRNMRWSGRSEEINMALHRMMKRLSKIYKITIIKSEYFLKGDWIKYNFWNNSNSDTISVIFEVE